MTLRSALHTRRPLLALALAASALVSLPACAPLLVGGAMVGGTLLYTDRRTSGAQIEDQAIELKAGKRLGDLFGDRAHFNITSYNRLVLLTGEVGSEADKAAAEQAVQRVENVRSLVNELGVMDMTSSLTGRSNDAILSGKVKASLLDAKDLMANAFKVVTERATDVARSVSGVQKVVRVFELITEAELANLQPPSR
jgi:osmotically-inducible protein OsmY